MNSNEIKSALEKNPNDANLWFQLGNSMDIKYSYETQKEFWEKIECYRKAVKLNPMFEEAYYNIAKLSSERGDGSYAIQHYEKVKMLNPSRKGIDEAIKNLMDGQKKMYERSIKHFEDRLTKEPDNAELIKQFGILCRMSGEKEKGRKLLEYSIELNPELDDAHYFLAQAYRLDGEPAKAIECYNKTIELEGNKEILNTVYNGVAECYMEMKDYDNAIEYYKKSVEYCPKEFIPQQETYAVGFAYFRKKDYYSAIEYYEKAIGLKPDSDFVSEIYRSIGESYFFLNEREEAEKWFEKTVSLKKDDYKAFFALGYINFLKGEDEFAEVCYKMSLQANAFDGRTLHNLGLVYQRGGDFNSAIEYFKRALEVNPEELNTYIALMIIYESLGDYEAAVYYLDEYEKRKKEK